MAALGFIYPSPCMPKLKRNRPILPTTYERKRQQPGIPKNTKHMKKNVMLSATSEGGCSSTSTGARENPKQITAVPRDEEMRYYHCSWSCGLDLISLKARSKKYERMACNRPNFRYGERNGMKQYETLICRKQRKRLQTTRRQT